MKTAIILTFLAAMLPLNALAANRFSPSYALSTDALDAGGQKSASASYANDGIMGSISGISSGVPSRQIIKHGYIGQLYEVIGVTLAAASATVDETAANQVTAIALLDDETTLALPGSEVSWKVVNGPITAVTPDGLATATNVYQDTTATIEADYLGHSSTFELRVLNVGVDDYGRYAGDGIRDDWQMSHFGPDNPNAAPGADPDRDGQDNVYEFVAGTDPVDPLSLFRLAISNAPGQPGRKNIIFNPRLQSRTYTVQFRDDLNAGPFEELATSVISDNGLERIVTDLSATAPARFYRVQISFP